MRLPRLLSGGTVVAVLVGTAACGLQTVEPKLELRDAADAFSSSRTTSLRLSLPSSLADVKAFGTETDAENPADSTGTTASSGTATSDIATATATSEPMSDADLQQLLGSHIDLAFDKGADAKGTADDAARALVHIGRTDAGEVRTVGGIVYARVDLTGLEAEFPDMKDGVESTRAALSSDQGTGGPPAELRAPLQAVFDGTWVSVDDRPGSWLEQQLKGQDSPAAGLAADAPDRLKTLAGKAFGDGVVTVKRVDGDEQLGDHLVATADLRKVYTNIRGDLPGLFTGDTATQLAKELPAAEKVPDRDLAVSFWVKNGTLTRVELDAAQFLDRPAGHLVVRADALPAQPITAPSGAVAVDLQKIADANGGSLAGLLASGGAGAEQPADAQTLAVWVDEDIRDAAAADGARPSASYLAAVQENYTDMDPPVTLKKVGKRIQVTVGGTSACLALGATTDDHGTVTDGHC